MPSHLGRFRRFGSLGILQRIPQCTTSTRHRSSSSFNSRPSYSPCLIFDVLAASSEHATRIYYAIFTSSLPLNARSYIYTQSLSSSYLKPPVKCTCIPAVFVVINSSVSCMRASSYKSHLFLNGMLPQSYYARKCIVLLPRHPRV
jgi:hypothetical protein